MPPVHGGKIMRFYVKVCAGLEIIWAAAHFKRKDYCYLPVKNSASKKYRYCKHITRQTPFELSAKIT